MSEDDKDFYRARIDSENKRRVKLGFPPKPIPFSVMNEEEQDFSRGEEGEDSEE